MLSTWIRSLAGRRRIALPVHVPARKSGACARPMAGLPSDPTDVVELLVPLTCRPELPVCPTVKCGDRIPAYAPLSEPDGPDSLPTFSPADAVVEGFTRVDTQHAGDLLAVRLRLLTTPNWTIDQPCHHPATRLESTEPDSPAHVSAGISGHVDDPREALADLAGLEDLPATLDELGVVTAQTGRCEPLGKLLRRAAAARTNLLVINAIQSEPHLASAYRLLIDATSPVATGARAIADYLSVRRVRLLADAGQRTPTRVARQMRRCRIHVIPVRTCYPGDAEPILLKRLFQRRQPAGGSSLDTRCLILSTDAAWRAGMALLHRRPLIAQPVTIAGDCLAPGRQGVYMVPLGLTVAQLTRRLSEQGMLPEQPRTIILGGSMTGSAVTDPARTVIDQTTQAVLLTHHRGRLDTTACIRCGWCVSGCPSGTDPIAILDALEARNLERFARLRPDQCICCNVCSSLCPSHLPLAQAARAARILYPTVFRA